MAETCKIVEVAKALVSEIEAQELPADFEPGWVRYNQIIAGIRHEYTNYDQLLDRLPLCVDLWERNGTEYCNQQLEFPEDSCPLKDEAHDLLKWAAKAAAVEAYSGWLEKR